MFNSPVLQQKQFCNKDLDVVEPLEPDEIIWENLAYTADQQKVRKIIMQIVAGIFLVLTTLFTIYMGAIGKILQAKIPDATCPSYYVESDPSDVAYQKKAYLDFDLQQEQQSGLMGCYCSRHSSLYEPWTLFMRTF